MYIIHIVISQWSVGTDTGMERLSSSNHSLFTKHLSLCKNFLCVCHFWPPSHYLLHFTVKIACFFWTLRVFKCFTAKSLDCWGGWQDHLVWLTYHFTQSKSCSLLETPLKYRNNAVVDKIVNSSWGHWGCCVEGTGSSSASVLDTGPCCDLCPHLCHDQTNTYTNTNTNTNTRRYKYKQTLGLHFGHWPVVRLVPAAALCHNGLRRTATLTLRKLAKHWGSTLDFPFLTIQFPQRANSQPLAFGSLRTATFSLWDGSWLVFKGWSFWLKSLYTEEDMLPCCRRGRPTDE